MHQSIIKIIRFRPLELKDLQFVRLIKPFEDAGVVEDFPHNKTKELKLLVNMYYDKATVSNYNFNHILTKTSNQEDTKSIFNHLNQRDDFWPTLCWYYQDNNGEMSDFHAIRNHYQLQTLLALAQNRHEVSDEIKG